MHLDPGNVAAILGMALATYACRGGGYWLFRQLPPSPALRTMLGYIPGALFVSYVVPALVAGGREQWVGALAALAIMRLAGNLSGAVLGGTAAAWMMWCFG
ncbi:MAG: AzlD domain-containing protein [Acetobacteraceae bacterium]